MKFTNFLKKNIKLNIKTIVGLTIMMIIININRVYNIELDFSLSETKKYPIDYLINSNYIKALFIYVLPITLLMSIHFFYPRKEIFFIREYSKKNILKYDIIVALLASVYISSLNHISIYILSGLNLGTFEVGKFDYNIFLTFFRLIVFYSASFFAITMILKTLSNITKSDLIAFILLMSAFMFDTGSLQNLFFSKEFMLFNKEVFNNYIFIGKLFVLFAMIFIFTILNIKLSNRRELLPKRRRS